MIVLHGDFKDLNFISQAVKPAAEEKHLLSIWEQFIKNGLDLTEKTIQNHEYYDCYKIFIHHYVFDSNCYTSYNVVDKTEDRVSGYLEHCKTFDKKFIDRKNNVLVMEETIYRGKIPANLEELKQREIKNIIKIMTRIKKALQEARENGEDQLAKVYEEIVRDYFKDIKKWKNKTSAKWFYKEAV